MRCISSCRPAWALARGAEGHSVVLVIRNAARNVALGFRADPLRRPAPILPVEPRRSTRRNQTRFEFELGDTILISDHAASVMRSAMTSRVRKRWRRALCGVFRSAA